MKNNPLKQNSSFHRFSIDLTLKEYRSYQKFFEGFLDREKENLEQSYTQYIRQHDYDKEDYSKFLESYFTKHTEITDQFPHSFRSSFLIQIVAFIESTLTEICEHFEIINKTNYSIHDLRGNSDIEKAKIYLTKTCGANFSNFSPEWQFILIAKKIRNSLIHNQGFIKKIDKDWLLLDNLNKGNDYFNFFPNGEYELKRVILKNKKFTTKLIDDTEKFFIKLLQEVNY